MDAFSEIAIWLEKNVTSVSDLWPSGVRFLIYYRFRFVRIESKVGSAMCCFVYRCENEIREPVWYLAGHLVLWHVANDLYYEGHWSSPVIMRHKTMRRKLERILHGANPKGSNCSLYKWAVDAFWICRAVLENIDSGHYQAFHTVISS